MVYGDPYSKFAFLFFVVFGANKNGKVMRKLTKLRHGI